MNWADYVIIAILLISVLVGIFRGFVREVMAIVVWAFAIWLAYLGVAQGAELLTNVVEVPSVRIMSAFGAIFLTVLIVGGLVSWLIGRLIESTGLAPTDRMVGMIFGMARGVVIVGVAVLLARFTPFPQDPWWQQSLLLPHFERLAKTAETWLPPSIQEYLPSDGQGPEILVSET